MTVPRSSSRIWRTDRCPPVAIQRRGTVNSRSRTVVIPSRVPDRRNAAAPGNPLLPMSCSKGSDGVAIPGSADDAGLALGATARRCSSISPRDGPARRCLV